MKLWIDDVRPMPIGFDLWAENYDQAVHFIETYNNQIVLVSFDHDLGDLNVPEKTGYDVLLYVAQMKFDNKPIPKSFAVHSANPVGCERMLGVIDRYLND